MVQPKWKLEVQYAKETKSTVKCRRQTQVQNSPGIAMGIAGKAIWKNSSKRRVLGQPAWAFHPVWIQSFLTDTKCPAVPQIFRILMVSAAMDKTCIKKCSPRELYNYFLKKLLKTRSRDKFCILTLTSRAICSPENLPFFFWNSVHHSHCHLTFEANRWWHF